MGLSVIFLIVSWILIGFVSIIACYCGNRPHRWYERLQRQRLGIINPSFRNEFNGQDNSNDMINNQQNYTNYTNYTTNSKDLMNNNRMYYENDIMNNNLPVDSMQTYDETTYYESSTRNQNNMNNNHDDMAPISEHRSDFRINSTASHNNSIDNKSSASMAGAADYGFSGNNSTAYGRSTRQRRLRPKRGMMDEVHPQYSPLLNGR